MSLINDALKRARIAAERCVGECVAMRPVETNQPEREFNLVLPVVIIVLGCRRICFDRPGDGQHTGKRVPSEKLAVAPAIVPKSQVAAAVPLATNPPAPAALPTNPPAVSTPVVASVSAASPAAATNSVVTSPPPKPLRLQGIAYDAVNPSAIIGGKAVYVGSFVDGMRVTAISPNSVTLAGNGRTKTLVVGEP